MFLLGGRIVRNAFRHIMSRNILMLALDTSVMNSFMDVVSCNINHYEGVEVGSIPSKVIIQTPTEPPNSTLL